MRDALVLAQKAASQHGLLTSSQLIEILGSRSAVDTATRMGFVIRRRRGLYEIAGRSVSWEGDVMAACLSSSRLIVASHRSALRLWGMRSVDDEVEVSVRYPGSIKPTGAVVHRSRDLSEHDVTFIEGVPVTTPSRTLCDAGLIFPDKEVQRLAQHALAKELVTGNDLERFRRRVGRQGRVGVCAIDRVLERIDFDVSAADSGPEIEMAAICREYRLPAPMWQHPVVACGRYYVIDFAYPEHRLAIEYDEYEEHTRPKKFEADRERQNNLLQAGWMVLRFTWNDLKRDPTGVARRIRSALVL